MSADQVSDAAAAGPRTAVTNRLGPAAFFGGVRIVAGRELAAYFDSAIAYVYTIAFVVLANSIFMNEFFLTGTVDMTGFFDLMPLLLAFFLPAITMRLWAEERKSRTVELLLTLPLHPIQATVGKYLAACGLFGLFLLGSLPIAVMLFVVGDPDPGLIFSGYLGLALFGGLFLAFGITLSALSSDQIVSFVSSTVLGFVFVLSGDDRVVAVIDGLFPSLALGTLLYDSISVMPHYEAFVRGALELSAFVYFGGLSLVFLWTCALVLERNRS